MLDFLLNPVIGAIGAGLLVVIAYQIGRYTASLPEEEKDILFPFVRDKLSEERTKATNGSVHETRIQYARVKALESLFDRVRFHGTNIPPR